MKKVLFTATVDSHIKNFHLPYLKYFKEHGYEVHVASNGDTKFPFTDVKYDLPFSRTPYRISNIKSYFKLKEIVNLNNFDVIHCHTPVSSVVTRLAARKARTKGSRVIYTAHGFHFYKGAPVKNWILYYPIEKIIAKYTDTLITINREDYKKAKMSLNIKNIEYVPGVGINTGRYNEKSLFSKEIKEDLNIPSDALVLLSVGELNKNKNHSTIINAIANLKSSNIYYIICGEGPLLSELKKLVQSKEISPNVIFTGFRKDLENIYSITDIFVFPSFREGLSLSLMEAMASGLPIVCSNIRGNIDLVDYNYGGYLRNPLDEAGFQKDIENLFNNKINRQKFGAYNKQKINSYSIESVLESMDKIYEV